MQKVTNPNSHLYVSAKTKDVNRILLRTADSIISTDEPCSSKNFNKFVDFAILSLAF